MRGDDAGSKVVAESSEILTQAAERVNEFVLDIVLCADDLDECLTEQHLDRIRELGDELLVIEFLLPLGDLLLEYRIGRGAKNARQPMLGQGTQEWVP